MQYGIVSAFTSALQGELTILIVQLTPACSKLAYDQLGGCILGYHTYRLPLSTIS